MISFRLNMHISNIFNYNQLNFLALSKFAFETLLELNQKDSN